MNWRVGWFALCGCGRLGFAPLPPPQDSAAAVDAPDAPASTFGPAIRIPGLGVTGFTDDPFLSADRLELYFANRPTATSVSELYVSRRAAPTAPWDVAVAVTTINSALSEANPSLAPDGLTIYFSSDRNGVSLDVYVARRATLQAVWSPPTRVAELSSTDLDGAPGVDTSGLHAVLDRGPAEARDLLTSTRATAGSPWSPPVLVSELSTSASDAVPWLDASGLVLYFSSDRPGGAGGRDLYRATRATPTAMFDAPVRLDELASAADETDPSVSDDESVIMFASSATGMLELYMATR